MNLVARQAEMKRRMGDRQAALPALDELSREVECPYCFKNLTKISKRTGELEPCRFCAIIERRIKQGGYALTLHEYGRMLRQQEHRCAICKEEFSYVRKARRPSIDHCHDLFHVRGLLCGYCNTAIGLFFENETFLVNAIKYLKVNRLQRTWPILA
jgi:hypothetical protein